MSAGHTPGPWVATERHGFHEILGPREQSRWFGSAGVWAVAYADTDREESEQEANARLIAAAPDMLTMLQSMLPKNVCLTNSRWPDSEVVPIDVTLGELRAVAALIAKATGAA